MQLIWLVENHRNVLYKSILPTSKSRNFIFLDQKSNFNLIKSTKSHVLTGYNAILLLAHIYLYYNLSVSRLMITNLELLTLVLRIFRIRRWFIQNLILLKTEENRFTKALYIRKDRKQKKLHRIFYK